MLLAFCGFLSAGRGALEPRFGGYQAPLPRVLAERDPGLTLVALELVAQAVMRDNAQFPPKLNAAANANRFYDAAFLLIGLAQGMNAIKDYDPPKGEETHYKVTMLAFIKATFTGIGACAKEDAAGLRATVAELSRLMGEGHSAHQ